MIELPIRVAAPDVTHVDALACGTRLGEFDIRGLIGVGGFGMVYRAYDHSLQRDVAIKEYMPTALAGRGEDRLNVAVRASSDEESFQTGLQSFIGEARMLAMFEHPSLVRVFRFWEANGTAYMVMPLYRGMTLKQARQCMRMPPTEAWLRKVMWSILGALKVLHRGMALHRDVSPDNIFLQDAGPPVLLDLGAARLALGDNAKPHTAILKVNYAPIEQYADSQDLPQGPWTDLYALAAVVHGMLCNDAPLPAMIRVVNDRMPVFANVVKTVAAEYGQSYSEQFVSGITWALQVQPQDRPQSVREFARVLGLSTPNGMSSFDWRAELGPACLPAGDVLQLTGTPPTEEKTRPNSRDPGYAPTQVIGNEDDDAATIIADWAPEKSAPAKDEAAAARKAKLRQTTGRTHVVEDGTTVPRKNTPRAASKPMVPARQLPKLSIGLMVATVVLSTLVAVAWGWRHSIAKPKNTPAVAQTTPQAASETGTAPAGEPMQGASDASTIPDNASKAPIAPPLPVAAVSAPLVPPDPVKPAKATSNERGRSAPVRPTKAEQPRAPVVAETASPPPAIEALPAKPEPKPAAPTVTPEKLCADSGFLTRPMCMYRACQRPDLAVTTTCIELEQRLKRDTNIDRN
jgi:serine/threonine protein kinase